MRALLGHLPAVEGRLCLELGCATGLTSHFLRAAWRHLGQLRLRARPRPIRPATGARPRRPDRRDRGAVQDRCVRRRRRDQLSRAYRERRAVRRPRWCACSSRAGTSCSWRPKGEKGRLGYAVKRRLGFTADQEGFGHARDGYPPAAARALLERHGIRVKGTADYCRFFTEFLEDLLNYAYHRKAMKAKDPGPAGLPRGHRAHVRRGAQQGRARPTRSTPRSIPRSAAGPCSTSSSRSIPAT